jgi:hypothetical protein
VKRINYEQMKKELIAGFASCFHGALPHHGLGSNGAKDCELKPLKQ